MVFVRALDATLDSRLLGDEAACARRVCHGETVDEGSCCCRCDSGVRTSEVIFPTDKRDKRQRRHWKSKSVQPGSISVFRVICPPDKPGVAAKQLVDSCCLAAPASP